MMEMIKITSVAIAEPDTILRALDEKTRSTWGKLRDCDERTGAL
jgi:hypothetical protein